MQTYAVITLSIISAVVGYLIKHILDLKMLKHTEAMSKKRDVYENIAAAINVFISGRNISEKDKDRFLSETSKIWLWAPDSVVKAINSFVDVMIEGFSSGSVDQKKAKLTYATFILEMRKDIGFPKTTLKKDEYKFVSFSNK